MNSPQREVPECECLHRVAWVMEIDLELGLTDRESSQTSLDRMNACMLFTIVWRMLGRWRKGVSTIQKFGAMKEKVGN